MRRVSKRGRVLVVVDRQPHQHRECDWDAFMPQFPQPWMFIKDRGVSDICLGAVLGPGHRLLESTIVHHDVVGELGGELGSAQFCTTSLPQTSPQVHFSPSLLTCRQRQKDVQKHCEFECVSGPAQ